MPVVLGLNHGSHDVAAAVIVDGELRTFVEQERMSGRRYAEGESVAQSVLEALYGAGVDLSQVDHVGLGSDHLALAQWLGLSAAEVNRVLPYDPEVWLRSAGMRPSCPISAVPHHHAHAHSAFWPSPFDQAALLVVDAMGEQWSASSGWASRSDGISLSPRLTVDESLGFFYEAACQYVGFGRHSAGKLMALASYGRPKGLLADLPADDVMRSLPSPQAKGRARVVERSDQLLRLFATDYFPYGQGDGHEPLAYADFAASVQHSVERAIIRLATAALNEAGTNALALSGGVALNCSATRLLASNPAVGELFIQPASIDSGVALGAALGITVRTGFSPRRPNAEFDPFLGPCDSYSDYAAAARLAGRHRVTEVEPVALAHAVAVALADGKIVAWHQGKAEVGPRALGARSLLGDPRSRDTTRRLNAIKERESWRPVAPSVLNHHFTTYFEGVPNPYMLVAALVRPERMKEIPAVVHVDGSARPQVVTASAPPLFRSLIEVFFQNTGCPMLANTSLNPRGRAPSARAIGSMDFFLSEEEIDLAAIGPFLIQRC